MRNARTLNRASMARNLDVAVAYGLNAGLAAIRERMRQRRDCPTWFIAQMDDMIERSNRLIRPLIEHRDEMEETRIDVPIHFLPEGARTSACGVVNPKLSASMAAKVDCLNCRKTELFRAYA